MRLRIAEMLCWRAFQRVRLTCAHPGFKAVGGYRNEKNFQNSVIGEGVDFVSVLFFNLL